MNPAPRRSGRRHAAGPAFPSPARLDLYRGQRARHPIVAVGLAVPWAAVAWFRPFASETVHAAVADGLAVCLLLYTLCLLLHRIVTIATPDFDTLRGAVAVYLLTGVVRGVWFRFIETPAPGSSASIVDSHRPGLPFVVPDPAFESIGFAHSGRRPARGGPSCKVSWSVMKCHVLPAAAGENR